MSDPGRPDSRTEGPAWTRRAFVAGLSAGVAGAGAGAGRIWARDDAPAIVRADGSRPAIDHGVASGDVDGRSAVVWCRTDRPARIIVEYATTDSFRDARRLVGTAALPETDFTARAVLTGLPPGQRIAYRVRFQDLASPKALSHPAEGRFRTAPAEKTNLQVAWGADVAGQGYGIDRDRGGMRTHASILAAEPDVFLHSGDHIYADNPIEAEIRLDDGSTWRNLVTEETSKVAETLAEFRGRFKYNLMDEHVRALYAAVPILAQWDDHETRNNWYPGQMLDDPRYRQVQSVDLLAARARRAFLEYLPTRLASADPERIYRAVSYGPSLEVFLLDERTYRGPNSPNRQAAPGPDAAFLGPDQLAWLKRRLKASRATWKLVASDMPIGLVSRDGKANFEAVANGDGPPLGRELEIADLLGFLRREGVRNVVWVTADVHYAAAHRYDPARARFTDFSPFWEFVAGPLHAGTFGPGTLDDTFGPQVEFCSIPKGMKGNRPPSEGRQFFGLLNIDGRTEALTASLHDREGTRLYSVELAPEV